MLDVFEDIIYAITLIFFISITIFIILLLIITPIILYADYNEVTLFNQEYGTNYTLKQWFWNEELIKETIIGQRIRLNIETNKLEIIGK